MDWQEALGRDYFRLKKEGEYADKIERKFDAEIEERLYEMIDGAIASTRKGFKVDFEFDWLKDLFERHALETLITAYQFAELEKQTRGAPNKRFSVPTPRLPRSLRELRKLWDKTRKRNQILKRPNKLYEQIRKAYLKKLQSTWYRHAEDFLNGDASTQEKAIEAIKRQAEVLSARAHTIVRTETTYYQNKARITFYDATPEVTHYLFLAIRDKATTKWCKTRTGLVFEKGTVLFKNNQPPCHWNCRSEMTPLVPYNPRHKKLIDNKSLRAETRRLFPLPPGWNSR